MSSELTPNGIDIICSSESLRTQVSQPQIFQVISISPIQSAKPTDKQRFRFVVSDGTHHIACIAASTTDNIEKFNICKMVFRCMHVNDKPVLVALKAEKLKDHGSLLGQPKAYTWKPHSEQNNDVDHSPVPKETMDQTPDSPPLLGNPKIPPMDRTRVNVQPRGDLLHQNHINQVPDKATMQIPVPSANHRTQSDLNRVDSCAQLIQPRLQQFKNPSNYQTGNQTHNTPHDMQCGNNLARSHSSVNTNNPHGMSMRTSSGSPIQDMSVGDLSPYCARFRITVLCIQKSDIRTFSNARGDGQLFSSTFCDNTGEMRGTAFGDVAKNLFDIIQPGKMYHITNPQVKQANQKYNRGSQYELTFSERTHVIETTEDTPNKPVIQYSFISIGSLINTPTDTLIDVAGVVLACPPPVTITLKTSGRPCAKRNIVISDESMHCISITLWNDHANSLEVSPLSVVLCKNIKLGSFGTRSLSTASATCIMTDNLEYRRTCELQEWVKTSIRPFVGNHPIGENQSFEHLIPGIRNLTVENQIVDKLVEVACLENKLNFVTGHGVHGSLQNITHSLPRCTVIEIPLRDSTKLYYDSCLADVPDIRGALRTCSKKVTQDEASGMWYCAEGHGNQSCGHRYILPLRIADCSGGIECRAFTEMAEILLGFTADELEEQRVKLLECADGYPSIDHLQLPPSVIPNSSTTTSTCSNTSSSSLRSALAPDFTYEDLILDVIRRVVFTKVSVKLKSRRERESFAEGVSIGTNVVDLRVVKDDQWGVEARALLNEINGILMNP